MSNSVSSKRHRQYGVNDLAQVLKQRQLVLNPGPSDRQSCAQTTELPHSLVGMHGIHIFVFTLNIFLSFHI